MNYMRTCPSPKHLFPETVRKPLRDLVSGVCPRTASAKRISALEFRVSKVLDTVECNHNSFKIFQLWNRQAMLNTVDLSLTWGSQ